MTEGSGLEWGVRDEFRSLVRRRRNGVVKGLEWFEALDRIVDMAGLLDDESAYIAVEEVRG